MNKTALMSKWSKRFYPLVGRTITSVQYMSLTEMESIGWNRSPLVIELDDGTLMFPSMDDEGNGAGALFFQSGKLTKNIPDGAPVI